MTYSGICSPSLQGLEIGLLFSCFFFYFLFFICLFFFFFFGKEKEKEKEKENENENEKLLIIGKNGFPKSQRVILNKWMENLDSKLLHDVKIVQILRKDWDPIDPCFCDGGCFIFDLLSFLNHV